ncbi:MAG: hypothetical protein IPQ10_11795 [Saprospiraceae bacterium]|jgi:hypothetical protein|nr:hypothetical protein [Saprospiraceae bacterium]MBK7797195.1 hypothetical protein [Saprospiraceae bacterium]MBL0261721.1 hypothetical protein [Saprospiraceae bacterium]MBX7162880.1 hypothetical protein [Saprospiraceae bacterium]
MRFILLACVPLLFSACCKKISKPTDQDSQISTPPPVIIPLPRFSQNLTVADTTHLGQDSLLMLRRTACFGMCPTYDLVIYQNGLVHFLGKNNVDRLGSSYYVLNDQVWNEIKAAADSANFFKLNHTYPEDPKMFIPDLNNTIIMINDAGMRNQVMDNHGAPAALKKLEVLVDDILRKLKPIYPENR